MNRVHIKFIKWISNKFGGDFDKLLEDIEKYAVLSHVEDYENAAKIRDYRIEIKAPLPN